MYDEARDILRGARIERDGVAGQVASALDQATALAPTEPPFTERWANNLADLDAIADHASLSFTTGLVTGSTGIVQFARQVNPTDVYNQTHPAEYQTAMSDLATGLVVAAADPGAMVSAVVEDARKNPFEALGALTGDALLTVATGGAGGGVAAARAGMHVADMAGDLSSVARHIPTPDVPQVDAPRVDVPTPEVPHGDTTPEAPPSTQSTSVDSDTSDAVDSAPDSSPAAPDADADPAPNPDNDGQDSTSGPDEPPVDRTEPDSSDRSENPGPQELSDADSGVREAADEAGCDANQTSNQICEGGDPVDVATGEFLLPETDVTLPGVLPLTFGRRHRSSYRFGRWFGPSWSTTVDMRIVVEEAGVTLLAEAGVMLTYTHPVVGTPTLPASGQLWPLSRTDTGGYRVHNPDRNITWHFAPKPELGGVDAALGNLSISAITDRHRNRIRFHYDDDGAPTEISHSGGYRALLETQGGRITALSVVDGDAVTPVRQFAYTDGHLTAVTNGVGGTTRYTYDDAGPMLSWRDANDNQMVNTYDEAGRVVVQRGTAGIMDCRFDYDSNTGGAGRTTVVTGSTGAATAHGFDNDLRLRDLLDPAGGHTHTDYNSRREPLRVVGPDGAVTRYLYTDSGDVARVVRPDGNAISIEYAGPHRPSAIRGADGSITRQEWDKAGNLVAVTDAAGARTQYSYHPNGTPASVTGPTGATTFIECDDAGLPVAITDPRSAITRILRDGFGRPESVIDPTGGITGYRWSADGQLLAQTHPDGTSESWVYDGEGNLLAHRSRRLRHLVPVGHRTAADRRHQSTRCHLVVSVRRRGAVGIRNRFQRRDNDIHPRQIRTGGVGGPRDGGGPS